MPSFSGFSDAHLTCVKLAYQTTRSTLEKMVTKDLAGASPSAKFRTEFTKFIGDLSSKQDVRREMKKAEDLLIDTIKAMNAKVASLTFKVQFDANLDANAQMLSWKFTQGNIQDLADMWSFSNSQRGGSPMTIGPAFFTLPYKSLTQQSQVQSFMHELSHHAAGTIDDGSPCYGQQGVQRLKGLGPLKAVHNAENVAFFIVQWA